VPSVVVKVMCVPLWGGTPACSSTCARTCVVPLTGNAVVDVVSVMVDPDGASSGTRWQASIGIEQMVKSASQAAERDRDIMKALTILIPMHLAGQGETNRHGPQAGYAMAALIVALAVMAVMMTVAMPVWKQSIQRDKEEEMVFRGEQIARGVGLFQRKFANAYPPTLDVLVEQKFLRKKYKDPITNDDFVPLTQAQQAATPGGAPGTGRAGQTQGQAGPQLGPGGRGPLGAGSGTPGGGPVGGIIGVTSKSTDVSIRLYKGRSHYNEWAFIYTPPAAAPGVGGRGQPPGRGGPQGRQGQPGPQPGPNNPFGGGSPFGPRPPGSGGPPGGPGPNPPAPPLFPGPGRR
jgi:type II secretory pathway pseudopilin PulG